MIIRFPVDLCSQAGDEFRVSWTASVWASIKLLAALKLLTVIKNDLDVISYISKRREYAKDYEKTKTGIADSRVLREEEHFEPLTLLLFFCC